MPTNTSETFEQFFKSLGQGTFSVECQQALAEVTRACSQSAQRTGTGKAKGKLTITLDIALDRGVFDIGSDLAIKLPKAIRGRTVAFETKDGGFSLSNPQQMELPMPARDTAVEQERLSPRDLAAGEGREMRIAR